VNISEKRYRSLRPELARRFDHWLKSGIPIAELFNLLGGVSLLHMTLTEHIPAKEAALKLLRTFRSGSAIRTSLRADEMAADPRKCPLHERCEYHGFFHGGEAAELRERLEKLLGEGAQGMQVVEFGDLPDPPQAAVLVEEVQKILDEVDCRDSLAAEEMSALEGGLE